MDHSYKEREIYHFIIHSESNLFTPDCASPKGISPTLHSQIIGLVKVGNDIKTGRCCLGPLDEHRQQFH